MIEKAAKAEDIDHTKGGNTEKAQRLVHRLAEIFPREHQSCPIGSDTALDVAIITPPDARDPALMAKLDAVAGRVLR